MSSGGIIPYRLEWHPSFGLRAQVNNHERFKIVRLDPNGVYFVIAWRWSGMHVRLDPDFIRAFMERRAP